MKITIECTAKEIIDSGHWDDYCEKYGTNVWAVNEGLMDSDEKLEITREEAEEWGFDLS